MLRGAGVVPPPDHFCPGLRVRTRGPKFAVLHCRCAYESMLVALARYHHRGLYAIERSSAAAMDRLAVAARQLPHADREVLSDTYHPASKRCYIGSCSCAVHMGCRCPATARACSADTAMALAVVHKARA
jgi:hypothetical protein